MTQDTSDTPLGADKSIRNDLGIRLASTIGVVLLAVGCVPGRPGRLLEADEVGLIAAVGSSASGQPTAEMEDGRVIHVPENSVALNGSGYNAGDLLLYGEDFGRSWYARLSLSETAAVENCYSVAGFAYDEPDAVVFVSDEWRSVGLRLPKQEDLEVPDNLVDSDGRFRMGGEELPFGSFCVDTSGSVFAVR